MCNMLIYILNVNLQEYHRKMQNFKYFLHVWKF